LAGATGIRVLRTRKMTMRATRNTSPDFVAARRGEHLPDGVGGTVTGWPMEKLDLMEILNRTSRGVTRGGAVSGAAQAIDNRRGGNGRRTDIALSDGSRISFASIEQEGMFRNDLVEAGTDA